MAVLTTLKKNKLYRLTYQIENAHAGRGRFHFLRLAIFRTVARLNHRDLRQNLWLIGKRPTVFIGLGYCQHLRVGKIIGSAIPAVSHSKPATILVDAHGGFAHPAFDAGAPALITAARKNGIAMLGVANAYACGVLGYFSDRLARAGMVSICVTNASSTMGPWGGKTPYHWHQSLGLWRAPRGRRSVGDRQLVLGDRLCQSCECCGCGRAHS